jgi:hypothetical protein
MVKTAFISKTAQVLTVLAFGMAAANVQALSTIGAEVDNTCSAFNGTKPYSTGRTNTPRTSNGCGLCHNTNNLSISVHPEWEWAKAGAGSAGQKNFCFVQGNIASPAANVTISQGGTINLAARGFSPKGKTSPLTFTWSFSDGRPNLIGPAQSTVPLPNAGDLTITLNTSDKTGAVIGTDPTPDTRLISVKADPIAAVDDTYSVQSGYTLSVQSKDGLLANDAGVGTLTAALGAKHVAHGVLNLNANGSFSYTPTAGFVGTGADADSFTYTASNGILTSAPATVTLTVSAAPPVANADSYPVQPGVALTVAAPGVLANDAGSGTLTAVLKTTAAQGILALNANGGFIYTPNAGFTGTDRFTYAASNGTVASAPSTVILDVGACTDKDKDGYSPEGGSCGPLDCNDKFPSINPGVKEICTNKLDDDCNGLVDQNDPACSGADCVGKLTANQVLIDSANWTLGKLTVAGSKAQAGATVTVSRLNPANLAATPLGTATVAYNGTWKFEQAIVGSANAPCRVKVEINGASGVRAVTGSTADCASQNGAPASCGL